MSENKPEKIGNLKSKLDGNRLDLSLCELSTVPVKEIVDLKKVTDLDLSRNRLSTLTPEFCTLATLTTLDLSSNYLRALPDRFGSLHALQRLDLYKNQLTDLPLSFCKLKQLKWLDLKDNCLNEQLRTVAGDFSSEKDCRQAATKVVQYMQKRQSDHERERQKRLNAEREAEASKKAKEEAERKQVQMEKKKQKENKKKNVNQNVHQNTNKRHHTDEANGTKSFQSDNAKHRSGRFEHRKSMKNGWSRKVCRFLCKLLLCLICIPILLSTFVIVNCSMEREILPKSRPLCHDVYNFMTTGRIHVTWDHRESASHVIVAVKHFSDHVLYEVKHFDYNAWMKWSSDHVTDFRAKLQPTMTSLVENAKLLADWSIQFVRYWSVNLWKSALIVADRTYVLGTEVAQWSVDTGRDVMQNYPTYWEKAKFYWKNLK